MKKIAGLLIKNKLTLAVAESVTGGLICDTITDTPGSSNYFLGGVIAYSNELKQKLLNIKAADLKKHGAVSEPVARGMAQGVRKLTQSDIGIAVTGIAGPSGILAGRASARKPVGLVYIALAPPRTIRCPASDGARRCRAARGKTIVKKYNFKGGRILIKRQTCKKSLEMLGKYLKSIEE